MGVKFDCFDLIVRTIDGTDYPMQVERELTVRQLKMHIVALLQIPPTQQRLLIGSKIIQDSQYMETWGDLPMPLEITLVKRCPDVAEWLLKVARDGMCLKDARVGVQTDPEVVLAAISQNGLALQFAAGELRADRDFIAKAVTQNAGALHFADADLRDDKEFVLQMVTLDGCAVAGASEALRADSDVVLAAAMQNHYALLHAAKPLKADHAFISALLRRKVHGAFGFASSRLQKDVQINELASCISVQ